MSASTTTNTQINLLEEVEPAKDRMFKFGADALSNAELLSLLLRTGTREHSATELALQLLKSSDGSLSKLLFRSPQELAETTGVGPAKAATLAAVLELARRVAREQMEQKTMLDNPDAVREYLGLTLRGLEYEAFVVLFLNSQHRLIAAETMFKGTLNQTAVYPREVLKRALQLNAAAVIISHNHPSGYAEPSDPDLSLTRTLQAVLGQVDIRVLDHIIVAGSQQYSFSQHGLL